MFSQHNSNDPNPNQNRSFSRRDFILRLSAGLASVALVGVDARQVVAQGAPIGLAGWNASTFAGQLGQSFIVDLGSEGQVVLTLSYVKGGISKIYHGPKKGMTSTGAGTSFILVFHGPAKPALASKTYTFQQAQLGTFSIFIAPSGVDSTGRKYIAVINHVHA